MFWRKKELSFDEELAVTVRSLKGWVDFIEMEIEGEPIDKELVDLGDITVATAKRHLAAIQGTIKFLERMQ